MGVRPPSRRTILESGPSPKTKYNVKQSARRYIAPLVIWASSSSLPLFCLPCRLAHRSQCSHEINPLTGLASHRICVRLRRHLTTTHWRLLVILLNLDFGLFEYRVKARGSVQTIKWGRGDQVFCLFSPQCSPAIHRCGF